MKNTITIYADTLPLLFKELNVNELKLVLVLVWFMGINNTNTFINSLTNREILSANGFKRHHFRLETLLESLVNKGILSKSETNKYQFTDNKLLLSNK